MNIEELADICSASGRRPHIISSGNTAVIATLGMEGRLFYARNGEVVSLFPGSPLKISAHPKPDISIPAATDSGPLPKGPVSASIYLAKANSCGDGGVDWVGAYSWVLCGFISQESDITIIGRIETYIEIAILCTRFPRC